MQTVSIRINGREALDQLSSDIYALSQFHRALSTRDLALMANNRNCRHFLTG